MCRFNLGVMLAVLGAATISAGASIVPIGPADFGPDATVETFEEIVGVELPLVPYLSPMSFVPVGYQFPSGVTLSSQSDDEIAMGYDSDAEGFVNPFPGGLFFGYSLGPDGGNIQGAPGTASGGPEPESNPTALPSGTAFLTMNAGTETFSFATPVARVGTFFESAMLFDLGVMGDLTIEAFDLHGQSLGSLEAYGDGTLNDDALDSWIGFETADGMPAISSITVTPPSYPGGDFSVAVLDDLTFEVPEPSALGLLTMGLLFAIRRR